MKASTLWLGLVFTVAMAGADDPFLTMPTEVTLTSGRVLRNVSVIRWETNRVILKHAAGADPVAFELFRTPSPAELPAIRAASLEAKKKSESQKTTTVPGNPELMEYSGRIVLTVDGVEVKVPAGTPIHIRERSSGKAAKGGVWGTPLGPVILDVVTDAEGNFSFRFPKDGRSFVISALLFRFLKGRNGTEAYEWRLPSENITDPNVVRLTEANASKKTTQANW